VWRGAWQFCLVAGAAIITHNVGLGFGHHIYDIDPANIVSIGLYNELLSTTAIFAALFSKTSFGLTLLRITNGWLKATVWFSIVSLNLALGAGALITWIQCAPVQKGWDTKLAGTCWDPRVNVYYGVAAASTFPLHPDLGLGFDHVKC
jgi:hypothetical protein